MNLNELSGIDDKYLGHGIFQNKIYFNFNVQSHD